MENQVVSNPKLIEGCKLWDKITTQAMSADRPPWKKRQFPSLKYSRPPDSPAYTDNDYKPLACRIDGNKAEATVGSSPGHAVHISLDKGKVEYHDNDNMVNEVMKNLLEEKARLKCEIHDDGVRCEGLIAENLTELFKVLSIPTSMDIRLRYCIYDKNQLVEFCKSREKALYEEITRKEE